MILQVHKHMPVNADHSIVTLSMVYLAWIVQECGFYVRQKTGLQFLRYYVWFSQIQSNVYSHMD